MEKSLINPRKGKRERALRPVVTLVAIDMDVSNVRQAIDAGEKPINRILTSSVFEKTGSRGVNVVGPLVGAPYAVLILEKLIALGAKKIVFLGWCGSVQKDIKTGDLIIPTGARVGEGTSPYYTEDELTKPSDAVVNAISSGCGKKGRTYHKGIIWSTDAPYRETKSKIMALQKEGVLGVEMEVSALFTVARFRGVSLGALLIVSDELASLEWKPGFSSDAFRETRKEAASIVMETCRLLYGEEEG